MIVLNEKQKMIKQYAAIFKALSNENRLAIYLKLLGCCTPADGANECDCDVSQATEYVGSLAKEVNISASTLSHHLKELRNAGLIYSERQGQSVGCWTDNEIPKELASFFQQWSKG